MTKWKDTTAGGHKILWREEIKEGERKGCSFGRVVSGSNFYSAIWDIEGREIDTLHFSLVPAEPEVVNSGWINVYLNTTSQMFTSKKYAVIDRVLGRIRIDWLDNGTFTVSKEEV